MVSANVVEPKSTANGSWIPEAGPVRLGVVGLNFGEGVVRHIQRVVPSLKLVSLCDQNHEKAARLAAELDLGKADHLDAMLEDPRVEAVAVFTGPMGRASLITRILQAGRHVITTKPFETELAAAARVLDEARERGLTVHLNSPTPTYSQDVAQIRAWVGEYQLGRPIAMQARTSARYFEKPTGTWYDDPALCPVAPILRLGIYFLNDFVPLLGTPDRVQVQQSRIFTERPTVDHAQVGIEYTNGATASILASFCIGDGKPYRDEVILSYENGTIRRWVERMDGPDMGGDHAVVELQTPGKVLRFQTKPGDYAGWYQWQVFARVVRGDVRMPRTNREQVLSGLNLLSAISCAGRSGRAEPVGRLEQSL
jgi:predicted dehydrogenase